MSKSQTIIYNYLQQMKYAARTGILVDIQNIGKTTTCIAVRENGTVEQLQPGVWLKKEARSYVQDQFTNIYDLMWDSEQANLLPVIDSSDKPYTLQDKIQKEPSTIAIMNGAFFFLTDEAACSPKDLPYNFTVRDGKIIGLPSSDEPILYVKNGKLEAAEPKATGIMHIGRKEVTWVGAYSSLKKSSSSSLATLYNAKCCNIVKFRDLKTNIQLGVLDNEAIFTPKASDVCDLIVNANEKGELFVSHIQLGGGTHFFDGLFILQIQKDANTYQVGDVVKPLFLDTIALAGITAGITVGKRVDDQFFLEEVRVNKRDVRSLIAKDMKGYFHFVIFDGSKYIPGFQGVSAKDITPYFTKEKFVWAYFLDGGGSSRMIIRKNDKLQFLANEFVFQKLANGNFLWDWEKGRIVASSISLRLQGN